MEVKGVQKLNLVPRVVEYEGKRQRALVKVAEALRERRVEKVVTSSADVTAILSQTSSPALKRSLAEGGSVHCISAKGLGGLLGWEPEPGVRLGKEVAEVARANSIGGVIHSDEFAKQGVTAQERDALLDATGSGEGDALVLVAGSSQAVERVVPLLAARLEGASRGVPSETRAATDAGETRYMRPRPGSQRMYPETDIPDIGITPQFRERVKHLVAEDWSAAVERLRREYSLSADLALKLYDSESAEQFESVSRSLRLEPSLVASALVDLPARLAREGVPEAAYTGAAIAEALAAVDQGSAAKEALPEILAKVGREGVTVDEAIRSLGLGTLPESEVAAGVVSVFARVAQLLHEKGDSAFSQLMGEAMRELRGRADGAAVARLVRERLDRALGKG